MTSELPKIFIHLLDIFLNMLSLFYESIPKSQLCYEYTIDGIHFSPTHCLSFLSGIQYEEHIYTGYFIGFQTQRDLAGRGTPNILVYNTKHDG